MNKAAAVQLVELVDCAIPGRAVVLFTLCYAMSQAQRCR